MEPMKSMVVAPQPVAAEEGVTVLRNGGNAVDAAVTAAFVQGVVDPLNCGIGGFGWMHIYMEEPGENVILDFSAKVGSKATADMWVGEIIEPSADAEGYILRDDVNEIGYQSIGVPGTVLGLYEALTRYGSTSWEEALRPAIELARRGYLVPSELALDWRVKYSPGRPDALTRFTCTPATAKIYTKGAGRLLEEGDVLVNEDLACSLERIAQEGPQTFYRGSMAEEIIQDLESHGGLISKDDLANFECGIYEPLRGTYRGYTVASYPPPAGGITLIEILNILEGYDLAQLGFNTADYIQVVSQAIKAGFADRAKFVGDPAYVDVPVERLISMEHARQWKNRIDGGERFEVAYDRSRQEAGTTHLSVIDNERNCVSLSHTCGLCSGVVTPGLGFLYNNYMIAFDPVPGGPNSIAPGKKRLTGASPTILFKDGEPFMVLGAPGGTRIISAVLQTILNVVDHGMTLLEAVSAPRIDCQRETIYVEGRVPRWVCEDLEKRGFQVTRDLASYGPYPSRSARVHAILVDKERGSLSGGADPRGYGVALSV